MPSLVLPVCGHGPNHRISELVWFSVPPPCPALSPLGRNLFTSCNTKLYNGNNLVYLYRTTYLYMYLYIFGHYIFYPVAVPFNIIKGFHQPFICSPLRYTISNWSYLKHFEEART